MKKILLGQSGIAVSQIALGCMRLCDLTPTEADAFVGMALDEGIDFFDHADIYGGGCSEEVFAAALKRISRPRESLFLLLFLFS